MSVPVMMSIDEALARVRGMTPEERKRFEDATADIAALPWVPQAGPQMAAYYCKADEMLYGGAAGGGKTDLAVGLASTQHIKSLIFRRQSTDLDGIWDRLTAVVGANATISNSVKKRLETKDGRVIEMGHLDARDSEKTWQGRDHDLLVFDEAAQLQEAKVIFVLQWLRSTTPRQRVRAVFATNPPIPDYRDGVMIDSGTGEWLMKWFAPWLDERYSNPAKHGELRWCYMRAEGDRMVTIWVPGPGWYNTETGEAVEAPPSAEGDGRPLAQARSRTFIRSLVSDNVFLRDSGYRERLSATPEPLRSMLLLGKFGVKLADHAFQVIPQAWVLAAQARWDDRMEVIRRDPGEHLADQSVLAADIAQGGIDSSVLVALREDAMFDAPEVSPGSDTPTGSDVVVRILAKRLNNSMIVLDGTGGWGGSTRDLLREMHGIKARMHISSEASHAWTADGRFRFLNQRAKMWWRFREALDPESGEDIMLPPSDALRTQLTSPHWKLKGNQIQVEDKDALRSRLGSSTDEADAVLMAWAFRAVAIAERHRVDPVSVAAGGWNPGAQERFSHEVSAALDNPLSDWDA